MRQKCGERKRRMNNIYSVFTMCQALCEVYMCVNLHVLKCFLQYCKIGVSPFSEDKIEVMKV